MNAEQRSALRKLAEEATPGPWNTYLNTIDNVIVRKMHETGYEQCVISYKSHYKNATYIAAANPQAIRELLDYIDQLEKEVVRYRNPDYEEAWYVLEDLGVLNVDIHDVIAAFDAAMQGETK